MIVAFSGQKGSGKDMAAERLRGMAGAAGITASRIGFADLLYESAAASLGVPVNYLHLNKNNEDALIYVTDGFEESELSTLEHPIYQPAIVSSITVRKYLQLFGTEGHRVPFGTDFWVEQALPLSEYRDRKALITITDCRFPSEALRVKALGGIVVKVIGAHDRPLQYIEAFDETGSPAGSVWVDGETGDKVHESETALCDWSFDFAIRNTTRNDNFAALDNEVEALLRKFKLAKEPLAA